MNKKKSLLFVLSFSLAASAFCAAGTAGGTTETSLYNEITSTQNSGFYPGTVEKASEFENLYPQSVYINPVKLLKSEALISLSRFDQAGDELEKLLPQMEEASSDLQKCYYFLGKAYYFSQKKDKALPAFYNAALLSKGKDAEIYTNSLFYSAEIYFEKEDYKNAILLYENVVTSQNDENFLQAIQKLILSYNHVNPENAIKLFNSLKKEDFTPEIYYTICLNVAESYEKSNLPKEAYRLYSSVAECGIKELAIVALKKAYILAEKTNLGLNTSEIFTKTKDTFSSEPDLICEFWIRLGIDEFNQKNYTKAAEYFESAEKLIDEGIDADKALIFLYENKIKIEQRKNLQDVEKVISDLQTEKALFENSKTANILDSYNSTLIYCFYLCSKFDEIEKTYPNLQNPDSKTKYIYAVNFYNKKDFQTVEKLLSSSHDSASLCLYCSALCKEGKVEKSLPVYKSLYKNGNLDSKNKIEYAKALFRSGYFSLADLIAAEAKENESDYISGLCQINLGNFSKAETDFVNYIKKQSSKKDFNNLAFYYKGYAEYCSGDFKTAYASFVRFCLEADDEPGKYNRSAYEYATKSCLQNGDLKNAAVQAEKLLKNSVAAEDKNEALILLSEIYTDLKDYEKAISILSPYSVQKNDFAIRSAFQIAKVYEKKGDFDSAESAYEKIYSDYPKTEYGEEALYRTAELFYSHEDFSKAEKNFNNYIYKYTSGKFIESAMYLCADCDLKLKNYDKSIMFFKTILSKYPECTYVYGSYINLVSAYYETEDYQNALACAKEVYAKFQNQASDDGIGKKIIELEQIVSGTDSKIAKLLTDYEKNGKTSTKKGRNTGSELVKVYSENPETMEKAFVLACNLVEKQTLPEESLQKADNSVVIADYYYSMNQKQKASEQYLNAAKIYRSLENQDENKIASCLYSAVECFASLKMYADAKDTADLLIQLYPESHQALRVNNLLK